MRSRRPGIGSSLAISLLLDLLYLFCVMLASPLLAFKILTTDKYKEGLPERLGWVPRRTGDRPCLWIHAVSLGEVLSIRAFIEALRAQLPGWDIAISATTKTGYAAIQKHFPAVLAFHFPLDFSWIVGRVFDRIRPAALVFVEQDLWPNTLLVARRRRVPTMLVNGRMSPGSHRGYMRFRPWIGPIFGTLALCCVQEETYKRRWQGLGIEDARLVVTGSMKFDTLPAPDGALEARLRAETGLTGEGPLLVGGSTHWPEERYLLATVAGLQARYPGLRLAICPRHPGRGAEVSREAEKQGLKASLRSREDPPDARAVWVFDTIGELVGLYGLADLIFVGGSLVEGRGGQNMVEPAALGRAVMFGPHVWNFADSVEMLKRQDACRQVADPEALTSVVDALLADSRRAAEIGANARRAVQAQRGASQESARLVAENLLQHPVHRSARCR